MSRSYIHLTREAKPLVSVAIATYEMSGKGRFFLHRLLESVASQDYVDIEVVVSDDSADDEIQNECLDWGKLIRIKYVKNTGKRYSASAKFNSAIKSCSGEIVKILCQDDYLSSNKSISETVAGLNCGAVWLVSSYVHVDEFDAKIDSHIPRLNSRIERKNSLGSHSCLAFWVNEQDELFDELLLWRMDCELYRRLVDRFGEPYFLLTDSVSVRQWRGQATNSIVDWKRRLKEFFVVSLRYPFKIKNLNL